MNFFSAAERNAHLRSFRGLDGTLDGLHYEKWRCDVSPYPEREVDDILTPTRKVRVLFLSGLFSRGGGENRNFNYLVSIQSF